MPKELTYAKGLEGVVANESCLSQVKGEEGTLRYLGYNIDDLARHCTFEEVVFLLHRRKLPTQSELDTFVTEFRRERELPRGVLDFSATLPETPRPWTSSAPASACSASTTRGTTTRIPISTNSAPSPSARRSR